MRLRRSAWWTRKTPNNNIAGTLERHGSSLFIKHNRTLVIWMSAIWNFLRCVFFDSRIHTEIFLGDQHIYTPDQQSWSSLYEVCHPYNRRRSRDGRRPVRTYLAMFLRLSPTISRWSPPISDCRRPSHDNRRLLATILRRPLQFLPTVAHWSYSRS